MPKSAGFPKPVPLIDTFENINNTVNTINPPDFAPHDFPLSLEFLKQYSGNNTTFESYRREIERLLQWAWLIEKKSILDLKRQEIERYINFCLHPPKSWIGTKRTTRFRAKDGTRTINPEWYPFVSHVSKQDHKNGIRPDKQKYQLSQKSIQEIFTVLSSFYNYLAAEEKTTINPIALIKQKSKFLQKQQTKSIVMRLNSQQWQCCLETAKEMAELEPIHKRTLFMLNALYLLYLRISELAASVRWVPQMNHFSQDSHGNWWFKTVGKGNKMREIAVPDDMLSALKRYRENMQLSPLPPATDKTPLLPKEIGNGAMTSTRHIRRLIQSCFDKTIDKLRERQLIADAQALEVATVHWLRHTGISDDINKRGRPVAHVRDDAGHSSSSTTDRYNDIELTERHESAKHKKSDHALMNFTSIMTSAK